MRWGLLASIPGTNNKSPFSTNICHNLLFCSTFTAISARLLSLANTKETQFAIIRLHFFVVVSFCKILQLDTVLNQQKNWLLSRSMIPKNCRRRRRSLSWKVLKIISYFSWFLYPWVLLSSHVCVSVVSIMPVIKSAITMIREMRQDSPNGLFACG